MDKRVRIWDVPQCELELKYRSARMWKEVVLVVVDGSNVKAWDPTGKPREGDQQGAVIAIPSVNTMIIAHDNVVLAAHQAKPIVEAQSLSVLHNLSALAERQSDASGKGVRGDQLMKTHVPEKLTSLLMVQDSYLIGGAVSGMMYCWDLHQGHLLRFWNAHLKAVKHVCISGCGQFIVSGGDDSQISVWRLGDIINSSSAEAHIEALYQWNDHTLAVTSLVASRCGSLVFSAALDGTVRMWDLNLGRQMSLWKTKGVIVHSVCLDPSETELYLAASDGCIYFINLQGNGSTSATLCFKAHKLAARSIAFDWAGNCLFSCGDDGWLKMWTRSSSEGSTLEQKPVFTMIKSAKVCSSSLPMLRVFRVSSEGSALRLPPSLGKHIVEVSSTGIEENTQDEPETSNNKSFLTGSSSNRSRKASSMMWAEEMILPKKKRKIEVS
jgi:WD40 repeat protein